MRTAAIAFSIIAVLLILLSAKGLSEANNPDGFMLVTFEWRDGRNVPAEVSIYPDFQYRYIQKGFREIKLIDEKGSTLFTGNVEISRILHHDRSDDNGNLRGDPRFFSGPITVKLPYYRTVSEISIAEKGRPGQTYNLRNISVKRIDKSKRSLPSATRFGRSPDYKRFIDSRYRATFGAYKNESLENDSETILPAKKPVSVALNFSATGIGKAKLKKTNATLQFYSEPSKKLVRKVEIKLADKAPAIDLPPGKYTILASCKYKKEMLYPYEMLITNFRTNAKKLKLGWNGDTRLNGTIKVKDGDNIQANVTITEEVKRGKLSLKYSTTLDSNTNGIFKLRLPNRSLTFVFSPIGDDKEKAEQMTTVQKIQGSKKGKLKLTFELPPHLKYDKTRLKRVWGTGDNANKFNFIYLSSGYTEYDEPFTDQNGNSLWDGDYLIDENGNGSWDAGEHYRDRNVNGKWDPPEPFDDVNGDTIHNKDERVEFDLMVADLTSKVLNFSPFDRYHSSFSVYSYWVPSEHSVHRMVEFPAPYNAMNTAFEVSGNSESIYGFRGKFELYTSANWTEIVTTATNVLPEHAFWIVLMRDPFNVMISNAAIMQSAVDNRNGRVLIHEMGHKVGRLADEYIYSGDQWERYTNGTEPFYPNLTIETDPAKVKWRKFFEGTPVVPTPEGTPGYGLFEGGSWKTGVYRPTTTSMMRSTSQPFFKVNEEALTKVLEQYK